MDEQVICVDDVFPNDFLILYKKYGVSTPVEGKIYTPREVVKHAHGPVGILLEEIKNPEVPVPHSIMGNIMREPTWAIRRFTHLNGTPLTEAEVKEWDRVANLTKLLNF